MFHAVEDGQDHRLRADGRRHISERSGKGVGLDGQEHDVERGRQIASAVTSFGASVTSPLGLMICSPCVSRCCRAGGSHEEGHVAAGRGEAAAEISAGRTRSDNQEAHGFLRN